MRLGQLARKLGISPTEITEYLSNHNIKAEEGANTRLADDQLTLLLQRFAPDRMREMLETPQDKAAEEMVEEKITAVAEIQPEPEIVPVTETAPVEVEETVASIAPVPETVETIEEDVKPEVIKAPKVALSGLKVLGKIELPQPRKKEQAQSQSEEDNTTNPTQPVAPPERKPYRGGKPKEEQRREYKPRKNPVALKREREEREAEEARREQEKQDKESRTLYYQQRVKASVPTKPARIFDEAVVEMKVEKGTEPKTWLGKFWKWYRS